MVPATFMFLEALPLDGEGKLDRTQLPQPQPTERLALRYMVPRTPVEESLARLWEEVLRLERVGVHDNFFEIGGNSIIAVRLIARANSMGLRLGVRDLFETPTIAGMSGRALRESASAGQRNPGVDRHLTAEVPLPTLVAKYLHLRPQTVLENVNVIMLECQSGLDITLLAHVLRHLVAKHDALRLSVTRQGSVWKQQILPYDAIEDSQLVEALELACTESAPFATALREVGFALARQVNLAAPPLIRAALCTRSDSSAQVLLIAIHHCAFDSISAGVLLRDLQRLWGILLRTQDGPLPMADPSLRSWLERLGAYGSSPQAQHQLSYWVAVLTDGDATEDLVAGATQLAQGSEPKHSSVALELGTEDTHALTRVAPHTLKAQIDDLLLTAVARALGGWRDRNSITLQHVRNGRVPLFPEVDISDTVGWLAIHVPVRLDTSQRLGVIDALASTQAQMGCIPDEGIGYGVLRHLRREPALVELAEPKIYLNHLGDTSAWTTPEQSQAVSAPMAQELFRLTGLFSAFDIPPSGDGHVYVFSTIYDGRLRLRCEYESHSYRLERMQQFAGDIVEALRSLAAAAAAPAPSPSAAHASF
jgi:non-ribosomal peptide synthase protein (TIGR01720 family)